MKKIILQNPTLQLNSTEQKNNSEESFPTSEESFVIDYNNIISNNIITIQGERNSMSTNALVMEVTEEQYQEILKAIEEANEVSIEKRES